MRRTRTVLVVVTGVMMLAASSCTTRLGTLGGWESTAADINAGGTVVGSSTAADNVWHAYAVKPGGEMIDLGLPPDVLPPDAPLPPNFADAHAINDAGTVVGTAGIRILHQSTRNFAFRWTENGGMVGVPGLSEAHDISEGGTIVGAAADNTAGIYEPGASMAVDLPGLPGAVANGYSMAHAVNERGDIVGCAQDADSNYRPVWWSGPAHEIHVLAADATGPSCVFGINDTGIAAGWWYRDGVQVAATWDTTTGGRTDIADNATAHDVNNEGVVVGQKLGAGLKWHAFRWTRATGTFVDLDPSGGAPEGTETFATAINDAGTTVGYERPPGLHIAALEY